ncbi:MAG: YidH family protein [Steroidobacteraceae bacterium]
MENSEQRADPMESVKENDKVNPPRSYGDNAACAMVYYAAERTLFAWVRTALGMMALGFVIDRFGLVLRMLPRQAGSAEGPAQHSFWAGTVLVLGGWARSATWRALCCVRCRNGGRHRVLSCDAKVLRPPASRGTPSWMLQESKGECQEHQDDSCVHH